MPTTVRIAAVVRCKKTDRPTTSSEVEYAPVEEILNFNPADQHDYAFGRKYKWFRQGGQSAVSVYILRLAANKEVLIRSLEVKRPRIPKTVNSDSETSQELYSQSLLSEPRRPVTSFGKRNADKENTSKVVDAYMRKHKDFHRDNDSSSQYRKILVSQNQLDNVTENEYSQLKVQVLQEELRTLKKEVETERQERKKDYDLLLKSNEELSQKVNELQAQLSEFRPQGNIQKTGSINTGTAVYPTNKDDVNVSENSNEMKIVGEELSGKVHLGEGVYCCEGMWKSAWNAKNEKEWAKLILVGVYGTNTLYMRQSKPRLNDSNLKSFEPRELIVLQVHFRNFLKVKLNIGEGLHLNNMVKRLGSLLSDKSGEMYRKNARSAVYKAQQAKKNTVAVTCDLETEVRVGNCLSVMD